MIHLVFKTHLDLGFTNLAAKIEEQYLEHYIPAALQLAKESRDQTPERRFAWTTGSYLIWLYLEKKGAADRKLMEEAISAGDIHWHALPFTTHTELADRDLLDFGLSISKDLDAQFGKKTISAKMTDVPGHTLALVDAFSDANVRFFHVGVNHVSTMPDVPPIFRWRSPSGKEVVVAYHSGGYGGLVAPPDSEHKLYFAHTNDNQGPQTTQGLERSYNELQAKFPEEELAATSMCRFAELALTPEVVAKLPVIDQEIGDSWIHGIGTAPIKVARYLGTTQRLPRLSHPAPGMARLKVMVRLQHELPSHRRAYLGTRLET